MTLRASTDPFIVEGALEAVEGDGAGIACIPSHAGDVPRSLLLLTGVLRGMVKRNDAEGTQCVFISVERSRLLNFRP